MISYYWSLLGQYVLIMTFKNSECHELGVWLRWGRPKLHRQENILGNVHLEDQDNSTIPLKWILDKQAENDRWVEISQDCVQW
jgi:hypothetical protein